MKSEQYLVYDLERRAYPLRGPVFTVGRDADSDLVLREPTVSRTHARVVLEGEETILESLGPTGTRVNGVAIMNSRKLASGDQILIGTAKLTFSSAPVPTGFTVVNSSVHPQSDPDTKRTTIRMPLLRGTDKKKGWAFQLNRTWFFVGALTLAVLLFIFDRG